MKIASINSMNKKGLLAFSLIVLLIFLIGKPTLKDTALRKKLLRAVEGYTNINLQICLLDFNGDKKIDIKSPNEFYLASASKCLADSGAPGMSYKKSDNTFGFANYSKSHKNIRIASNESIFDSPSVSPSISVVPSSFPSPALTSFPSLTPSESPGISVIPSSFPSPVLTPVPSLTPSASPGISVIPSSFPSPVLTSFPSLTPSESPGISVIPSSFPSPVLTPSPSPTQDSNASYAIKLGPIAPEVKVRIDAKRREIGLDIKKFRSGKPGDPKNYICHDFANELEQSIKELTFTTMEGCCFETWVKPVGIVGLISRWQKAGRGRGTITGHAINDVPNADGSTGFYEPQSGEELDLDYNGDNILDSKDAAKICEILLANSNTFVTFGKAENQLFKDPENPDKLIKLRVKYKICEDASVSVFPYGSVQLYDDRAQAMKILPAEYFP